MADCFCQETVLAAKKQDLILPDARFQVSAILRLMLSLVNSRLRIIDFAPKSKSQIKVWVSLWDSEMLVNTGPAGETTN